MRSTRPVTASSTHAPRVAAASQYAARAASSAAALSKRCTQWLSSLRSRLETWPKASSTSCRLPCAGPSHCRTVASSSAPPRSTSSRAPGAWRGADAPSSAAGRGATRTPCSAPRLAFP